MLLLLFILPLKLFHLLQERIEALETYIIIQAKGGVSHSVALTNKGQVVTWGSNEKKQLGRMASTLISSPKYDKLSNNCYIAINLCNLELGIVSFYGMCFCYRHHNHYCSFHGLILLL